MYTVHFQAFTNSLAILGLWMQMCFVTAPRSPIIGQRAPDLGPLILVGNLTNSKIAETKALEPPKS
jgi:hypothetical protein